MSIKNPCRIRCATRASCALENTYPDGDNYVCADCGHEWPVVETADAMVKDANGNVPADGDQARVAPVLRGAR